MAPSTTQSLAGSALLTERLKNEPFPMSRQDIIRRFGDIPIQLLAGCHKTVGELLEKSPQQQFEKPADVVVAMLEPLHPVLSECSL